MSQQIEHSGIIKEIQDNLIHVLIVQQSACGECDVNGVCSVSDHQEKIIEIESTDSTYQIGEKVILFGNQSIGLQAVFVAFVIPFILVLLTLIILQSFISNEAISGVIALLVLVPYYSILSFFNKKFNKKFKFEIKKDTTV
jgi:positive regulator of sigma E activity